MAELLRNASAAGLNVARVYAHTSDPEHPFMVPVFSHIYSHNSELDARCDTLGFTCLMSGVN